MSKEIKLEIYNFGVRNKRDKEYILLDKLSGNVDFSNFLQDYVKSLDKQIFVNDHQKKSIQFDGSKTSFNTSKRIISGVVESGDYGIAGRIVDRHTKKQVYRKKVDDLDIKPFYFLLYLPKKKATGILILQRFGVHGVNTVLTSHLSSFFKDRFSDLILDFSPFVSKKLARSFIEKGSIKELSLRRYNLPSDVIDKLGLGKYEEDILSIELRISAKPRRSLNVNDRVKKFINNPNAAFFDVKELKSIGFDGENESKIRVELGSSMRTIDLSDTGQIRPYYDIDKDVEKDKDGIPVFSSIDKIANDFLNDIISEI